MKRQVSGYERVLARHRCSAPSSPPAAWAWSRIRTSRSVRAAGGEWSGPSDIMFGRDGKPMYIKGPHDDTFRFMSALRKTVGEGNFHFVVSAPG